jgi:hypothetical protein
MVISWPLEFGKLVSVVGDELASHVGSTGGLMIGQIVITQDESDR